MFKLLTVTAALLTVAQAAYAQTPPAAPAPVPEVMPFDIPYGAPINLTDARKIADAAMAEAKKHNWKMAVAVVDWSGNLVNFNLMDGTQYASIRIAQAKAETAAGFRRPSKAFQDAINTMTPGPSQLSLLALVGGAASEGGFPLVVNGKLVGAIGCSGGIPTQDGATCQAGINALMAK